MKFSTRIILLTAVVFVTALGLSAAAPQVVIADIKGKVEVKLPGSTSWAPAANGQSISTLTTLSTGFDSSVTLVMDKTNIFVKPLTRLSIDKIVASQDKVSTSCYLRVGSVQASVKSTEGVKQDFKVQSAYSTASVRGTGFEFDGLKLSVNDGSVAFITGRPVREFSQPEGDPNPDSPDGQFTLPDTASDFIGTPDISANRGKTIVVGSGNSAGLTIAYNSSNQSSVSSSTDQDNLRRGSTVTQSANETDSGGSEHPQSTVPTTGSVTVTWTK